MIYRSKRLLDVVLTVPTLALSLPAQAVTAAIYLTIGSPVVFRQHRPGMHGEAFETLEFRSRLLPSPGQGLITDVDRITRRGSFLRITSLDELPAIWNIVKVYMPLVQSHPPLMQYLDRYTPEHARRHEGRPEVTDLARVSALNAILWDEKLARDVEYVDIRSFAPDVEIIMRTAVQVLRRDGVSAEGEATMSDFMGTETVA